MFSGKRVYVNEDGTIYSVEDESTKENLQPEKNRRQDYYSSFDQTLLAQIIKEVDPSGLVLFSAKKDGGTSKQKSKLWTSIVEAFNAGSGRAMPSTKDSLTKLASRMRSGCRKDADADRQFKKDCSKTGSGTGNQPPPDYDPDSGYSTQVTDVFSSLTNNLQPLETRFDDIRSKEDIQKQGSKSSAPLPLQSSFNQASNIAAQLFPGSSMTVPSLNDGSFEDVPDNTASLKVIKPGPSNARKQKRSVNASNVKDIRQEEVDVALDLLKEEKKFKILEHHLRLEKLKSDVSINQLKIDLLKRCYDGLKFDIGQS